MPLPCANQTLESVQAWVEGKPLVIGDEVVVRQTYGGMTEYRLDVVEKVDHGKQRRVILRQHGSFYRNGRNCFHPNGQIHFIQPTAEILEAVRTRARWMHGNRVDA